MGLFSFYLGYRHARKKAARRREWEEWQDRAEDPECDVCGHPESRHDEAGRCPSYG